MKKLIEQLKSVTASAAPTDPNPYYKDSIGKWIVACCIQDSSLRTTMKDLYSSYCSYCRNIRIYPSGNTSFGRELTRLQFLSCKIGLDRGRYGIGLKEMFKMPAPTAPKEQAIWFGTTAELLHLLKEIERDEAPPLF
jgi:hypothetical protein